MLTDVNEQLRSLEEFAIRQVDSCRESIAVRLQLFRENIDRHVRVAQALHAGLRPDERADSLERLQGAPNQPDVDHQ